VYGLGNLVQFKVGRPTNFPMMGNYSFTSTCRLHLLIVNEPFSFFYYWPLLLYFKVIWKEKKINEIIQDPVLFPESSWCSSITSTTTPEELFSLTMLNYFLKIIYRKKSNNIHWRNIICLLRLCSATASHPLCVQS
jgi:hypothetical protein